MNVSANPAVRQIDVDHFVSSGHNVSDVIHSVIVDDNIDERKAQVYRDLYRFFSHMDDAAS